MRSVVLLHRHALHAAPSMALSAALSVALSVALALGSSASSAQSTTSPGEPGTRRTVIEDDNTRIEELHVRGEAQRVVVQSKRVNLPAWEIRPDSPGRTPAGEQRLPRDTANTRMWRVMSF
jgi:hypothetical protein